MSSLEKFTEQALAKFMGKLPDYVYLPPRVRSRPARITRNGTVTTQPYTVDEQLERIVDSDPVGFLVALMNGQPIVTFELDAEGSPIPAYLVPPIHVRRGIAQFLVLNYVSREKPEEKKPKKTEYEQLLEARADAAGTEE